MVFRQSITVIFWVGSVAWPAHAADTSVVVASLCGKRVVALGELASHGEARAFQFKAELARGLVEQCGFDAVLFEAPIYDFFGFSAGVEAGSPDQRQLDNAIGRFWWTRELTEWRRWLMQAAGQRRLYVGGLDDQVSVTSEYAVQVLPELVNLAIEGPEGGRCKQAVRRNLSWDYAGGQAYDNKERLLLAECTRTALDAGHAATPQERRMLFSLTSYYERSVASLPSTERDVVMYQNLTWHLGRLKPTARVVVWTANVHAARTMVEGRVPPMGSMLARHFGADYAAIGGTALKGRSRMAGGEVTTLRPAPGNSLEAQGLAGVDEIAYLNSVQLREIGAVPSRLMGEFAAADWTNYFDGVFVVQDEQAPTPGW